MVSRLFSLRQGSRSVADFAIDFRTLAAESGWNTEALITAFHHSLSAAMKDELASRDLGGDLKYLITMAIRIDNRMRERVRQHHLSPGPVSRAS